VRAPKLSAEDQYALEAGRKAIAQIEKSRIGREKYQEKTAHYIAVRLVKAHGLVRAKKLTDALLLKEFGVGVKTMPFVRAAIAAISPERAREMRKRRVKAPSAPSAANLLNLEIDRWRKEFIGQYLDGVAADLCRPDKPTKITFVSDRAGKNASTR